MKTLVFDGKGAVLGRLGAKVSKELLKRDSVYIINAEEVVISGKKDQIVEKIRRKRRMGSGGSLKGPKYIRQSDRLLKRMIRGMLPWEKTKGREAYKRLKCYVGNGDLKEEDLKNIQEVTFNKPLKTTTLKEVTGALQ